MEDVWQAIWQSLQAGLPVLILHLLVAFALLAAGFILYMWMTPFEDIRLVREGNVAAATALGGLLLGLGIPLAGALAGSVSVWDLLAWGIVTIVIQMAIFKVIDLVLRDLARRIEAGEMAAAVLLAATKVSVGAITAAALVG